MIARKYAFSGIALVAAAVLLQSAPAHAISFALTGEAAMQASMKGLAGLNGETDQGAYSIYAWDEGFNTVTFNNYDFTVTDSQNNVVDNAGIQYSTVGQTTNNARITKNVWAPSYDQARDNKSAYSQVFAGTNLQIDLDETHNYFGINWGSAHNGNEFSFYNGENLVQKFVYFNDGRTFDDGKTVNVASTLQEYNTVGHGNQYNAYFNFFSESENDIFNRIVISQKGGGGFETDNHTFHAGTVGFESDPDVTDVPEPTAALGLLAVGGLFVHRRFKRVKA
ncbi:MAG: PEP-CTERM sorting domain-containing protein [Cyanobacteria bacterium J06636_16]